MKYHLPPLRQVVLHTVVCQGCLVLTVSTPCFCPLPWHSVCGSDKIQIESGKGTAPSTLSAFGEVKNCPKGQAAMLPFSAFFHGQGQGLSQQKWAKGFLCSIKLFKLMFTDSGLSDSNL